MIRQECDGRCPSSACGGRARSRARGPHRDKVRRARIENLPRDRRGHAAVEPNLRGERPIGSSSSVCAPRVRRSAGPSRLRTCGGPALRGTGTARMGRSTPPPPHTLLPTAPSLPARASHAPRARLARASRAPRAHT
eukprot:2741697-Prymnesium_polylepis.2